MRTELHLALKAATELPAEELPRLLGELEEVRCTALARLSAPGAPQPQSDRFLNVKEAAERLAMSEDYLYRNRASLPFAKKIGRRLLFSSSGIEKWMRATKP